MSDAVNSWRRIVEVLRVAAWRLRTPPLRRRCWAADLEAAATRARVSAARPVRELADGLAELAARAGRRRSWRWTRDGARDYALQLARLIEQEHPMPPSKPAKKTATKKTPKKATKRVNKRPPPHATQPATRSPATASKAPNSQKRLWTLAAYIAAADADRRGESRWNGFGLEAARALALRAHDMPVPPGGSMGPAIQVKPPWFTSWKNLAAQLHEIAVALPHKAVGDRKGHFRVSPYALVIATTPGHEFFDPRGLREPPAELVASVDALGIADDIKVYQLVERGAPILYVDDGRTRLNAVYAVNLGRIRTWETTMQMRGLLVGAAATPPELILEVPVERLDGTVKEAQLIGGVLNSGALRRDDSLRDLAHRVPSLKKAGYTREQIALQLGISAGTVSNLLSLVRLDPELEALLWADKLSPACAYQLATQEAEHQGELWELAARLPAPRRAGYLRDLITAEARVDELGAAVRECTQVEIGKDPSARLRGLEADLAGATKALEKLRKGEVAAVPKLRPVRAVHDLRSRVEHLHGEGGRLVLATIDFVLGLGKHADLEALVSELASSPAVTVHWRGIECPDCCVDPGQACVDENGKEAPPCEGRVTAARIMSERAAGVSPGVERVGWPDPDVAPASTVDGRTTPKRGGKKGDRAPQAKAWGGFSEDDWEESEIFDERQASELVAAGLTPLDMRSVAPLAVLSGLPLNDEGKRLLKAGEDDGGHWWSQVFKRGWMTPAQIKAVVRQLPLLEEAS